jgi:hypothetical protein
MVHDDGDVVGAIGIGAQRARRPGLGSQAGEGQQ